MTRFITLAGKKQVGKDTSAHFIKELVGDRLHLQQWGDTQGPWTLAQDHKRVLYITHFADALKRACATIFGIEPGDMETEEGKQKLTDVRWPLLDTRRGWVPYSDDVSHLSCDPKDGKPMTVRQVLQFVGTELLRLQLDPDVWIKSVYRRSYQENSIVVVADCRFPNEADFARENGTLISIERDTDIPSDGHISETVLDDYNDYHYVVDNSGSFDDLREQLRSILTVEGFLSA